MTTYPETIHPLDDLLDTEERERFIIQDDSAAAWAMRKLRAIAAKKAEYARIAADEQERITRWLDEVTGPLSRDAAYFEAILSEYALRCRENPDDGRKSIALPGGKVTTRTVQPKMIASPEFIEWAQNAAKDLLRVKVEADLTAMKQSLKIVGTSAVTPDGEVVPGVVVTPESVSTSVAPDLL